MVTARRALLLSATGALASILFLGCGSSPTPVAQSSGELYEAGVAAFESGNYVEARDKLTQALEAEGGFSEDSLGNLFVTRARAFAELAEYDNAFDDLEIAAQGAPLDQVHAARGDVYLKKGDKDLAKSEYAMAKSYNPAVKLPMELQ